MAVVLQRAPAPNNDGMGCLLFGNDECRFRVWAPSAEKVELVLLSPGAPDTTIALKREMSGNWSAVVKGVQALQKYKYRIKTAQGNWNDVSEIWKRTDARALQVEHTGPDAASFIVDQRQFTDGARPNFRTPGFEDFLIYQLHVGTFNGRNSRPGMLTGPRDSAKFWELEEKLGYLKNLNFNAIALLPIGENPGDISEGYAPSHHFAPESAYASSPPWAVFELRRLIDAAHRGGLAVIFDVVYNHASFDDNQYWRYDGNCYGEDDPKGGIYFSQGHKTQFGDGYSMGRPEVRDFFLDNARLWLRDYRVDGIRFDAVHLIRPDAVQFIIGELRREFPDKYLIAEYNPSDGHSAAGPMDPFGELHFHATWDMAGPSQMYSALSGSNPVDNLLTLIGDFRNPNPWCSIRYSTSHDEANRQEDKDLGKGYLVERFGGRANGFARAKARLAWSLAVALPGNPMMFMGTEGHLDGFWDWRRDNGRGDHRPDWNLMGDPTGAPMQRMVSQVNKLRWDHRALRSPAGNVTHVDRQGQVVAFKRYTYDGDIVLVVVNVSDNQWAFHDYGVNLGGEAGTWLEIFNSQAPEYGGFGSTGNFGEHLGERAGKLFINLPRWSVVMFRKA
jgi:1,4-alpha-glucan branching enzyme